MKTELIVCRKLHRENFLMEEYSDSDDILIIVQNGSFESKCKKDGKPESIQPYEGYCFKAGMLYERHVKSPVDFFIFRYKSDEISFPSGKIIFKDKARVISTLKLLDSVLYDPRFNEYQCKKTVFFDILLQYRAENAEQNDENSNDLIISYAREFISDKMKEKIDFFGLSESCGLSYMQFFRRFKKETGLSPSEYLSSLRLKRAVALLESTTLSIKTVAEQCGFYDEYYFSNFFKKHMKVSPTKYRENNL